MNISATPLRSRGTTSEKFEDIASSRSWVWPVLSAAIGLIAATTLSAVHRQVDLGTYLLGGAHAFQPDLYHVVYQPTGLGFTYPPFAALWFVPLSHFPVQLDQTLFTLMSLVAFCCLLAISVKVTSPTLSRRSVVWWSLLLVTPLGLLDPIRETLLLGQVNNVLGLAVIADVTMVRPGRRGFLVGLAAAIKLTPIIFIPYFFLTHQRGAWQRALVTFVVADAIGVAVATSASWSYWIHDVWSPARVGWLPWVGNQGVDGVVERLLQHTINAPLSFGLTAVVSLGGMSIAVRAFRLSSPLLGFLVIQATESLASPVSWSHHFVWVVFLIAWLALAVDRPRHGELWAALVSVIFWAAPIWWVPHGPSVRYAGHGWSILLADSFCIVMIAIPLATAIRLIRQKTEELSGPKWSCHGSLDTN